jgi:carbamoyl-phosphate synthase large subunit
MEVNPRLGGAVLASIEAGYNIPKIMLQDATNLKTDIILKGKEILMKRYFMEEYYETNN